MVFSTVHDSSMTASGQHRDGVLSHVCCRLGRTLTSYLISACRLQGHSRDSKRWANPIRFLELDQSFAHVDSTVMPDTWGTVEDSVTQLNSIAVQPMGAPTRLP